MKKIRLDVEAADELAAAHDWYEEQVRGLGAELLIAIEAALKRVQRALGDLVSLRGSPLNWEFADWCSVVSRSLSYSSNLPMSCGSSRSRISVGAPGIGGSAFERGRRTEEPLLPHFPNDQSAVHRPRSHAALQSCRHHGHHRVGR